MTVSETISSLRFGDLIEIEWLDASESTGRLERSHARFDTPMRPVGYFLGVKGRRTKHVVIAKEIIDNANAYHYNVIPTGMIENITVLAKDRLDPETKLVLRKFVHMSMTKLRGRTDGPMLREKIRSAFTRHVWIQQGGRKKLQRVEVPPSEKLVLGRVLPSLLSSG